MSIRETDLVRKLKQTIPQSLYFILEFSENNNSKSKSVSLHLLKKYFLTNIKVAWWFELAVVKPVMSNC